MNDNAEASTGPSNVIYGVFANHKSSSELEWSSDADRGHKPAKWARQLEG